MSHSHDQPFTPEEDAALAQTLLAQGDLTHGAYHLAGAIASDPHNPDWLALLDRYIAAAEDPLDLAPLKDGTEPNYFGTVALRAYILAHTDRIAEGVALLLQVIAIKPEIPYLEWALQWLERAPAAGPQVDRRALLHFFGNTLQRYPGTLVQDTAAQEELAGLLRLAEGTIGDPDPEGLLTYARAALARKLGRLDEALGLAERGYAAHPGYHLASAVAEVHKARNDEAAWRYWQETALRHDAANVPTRLDLGDYYLEQGRFDEAIRWYQQALEQEPGHPWATPSLYAAHAYQGSAEWQAKLQAYAAAHPDNQRAAALAQQGEPYVGYLPEPREATLGILQQLTEMATSPDGIPQGEVRITLSALEAPSARLGTQMGLEAQGIDVELVFAVSAVQRPDPRLPRRPVRYQVWKYKEEKKLLMWTTLGTEPVACVPEPPPALAAAVAALARQPFDRPRWFAEAAPLVQQHQPRVEQLLGIMAYPPEPPPRIPAPLWVQHVKVAAALALAHLDPETPWRESRRRQALFDLALGPMDWTVDAALIALTALANEEPALVPDILPVFGELLEHQPRPGYVPYEYTLVCCFQQLPGLEPELRDDLAEYRRRLEAEE